MLQTCVCSPLVPSKSVMDVPEEKERVWKRLANSWGKPNCASLGANPVSLSRKTLGDLHRGVHSVGLKADGVRYILYMCMRGHDSSPMAVMVDRARNMYEVEVMAAEDHFINETILEGELVWRYPEQTSMFFLVFDAVRIKGKLYVERPFHERLSAVEEYTRLSEELAHIVDVDELEVRVAETDAIVLMPLSPPITIRPKKFVDLAHAASLWDMRGDVEHRVDGLIINRTDASYKNGTAMGAMYKWKPLHSVDLAGPADCLMASEGPIRAEEFDGRRIEVEKSRIVVSEPHQVAEYRLDVSEPGVLKLFAMRTRPDKGHANGLRVVYATMMDALHSVQPSDLCR